MADEQAPERQLALELGDQLEDRGLNGDIERARGFIGYDEPGVAARGRAIETRWR